MPGTYFYDTEGKRLAYVETVLPIPLFKGMKITIHDYPDTSFTVSRWEYHHGYGDEESGLKIFLQPTGTPWTR